MRVLKKMAKLTAKNPTTSVRGSPSESGLFPQNFPNVAEFKSKIQTASFVLERDIRGIQP